MKIDTARQPRLLVLDQSGDGRAVTGRSIDRLTPIRTALESAGIPTTIEAIQDPAGLRTVLARVAPALVLPTFFRFLDTSGAESYLGHSLSATGIPRIGSEDSILEVALSKPMMKTHWRRAEIPTPDWFVVGRARDGSLSGLEHLEAARAFPYFVKPSGEGNSRGIDQGSVVRTPLQLYSRATMVAEKFGEAIIEDYIGGGEDSAEFTAAMVGNGRDAIVSAVQVGNGRPGLISEEDKDGHATRMVPISDPRLRKAVEKLARRAFLCAGARDYARCDILSHDGKLYAIELNGQPMIPDRWFAGCSLEAGMDDRQYLRAIVLAAILRATKSGESFIPIPAGLAQGIPRSVVARLSGKSTRIPSHE